MIPVQMCKQLFDDITRIKIGVYACLVLLLIIAAVYIVEKTKE